MSTIAGRFVPIEGSRQDALYRESMPLFAAVVERLARGDEANEARRQDLVQEIHVAFPGAGAQA